MADEEGAKLLQNGTGTAKEGGAEAQGPVVPDRPLDANGNPILTEAEQLQLEIKNATLESLESTRRMIQFCNDAKEAGINTLVMLDEQGGKHL